MKLDAQTINDAVNIAQERFGVPETLFVPEFGFVLVDGNPTDNFMDWYKEEYSKQSEDASEKN